MEQSRLMLEMQKIIQEKLALQKDSQLASMAKKLRQLREAIENAEKEYENLQEKAAKAREEAKELEEKISKLTAQIKGGKDRLYQAKGSGLKELLSLQQSIQKMEEDVETGEGRYLESLKEAEEYQAKRKEVRELARALKAQYNQGVREYKEEKQKIELKMAELQSKEEELAEQLDPEYLRIFRRTQQKYPSNPVAVFRNGNCSGCHISIPSFLAIQVKEGKTLCYCDNCGRILVQ